MLHNLVSLTKDRKRVGRGGCRGGTSGKGGKGQTARSGGKIRASFEGGQSPLTRRIPKRGFSSARFRTEYSVVNIDRLNEVFETGAEITKQALIEHGIISNAQRTLVKILANGTCDKKFIVHADAFSAAAKEAIQKSGGEVHIN